MTALVRWEDTDQPDQPLFFEVEDGRDDVGPSGEAFLAACFPLAVLHGERRVQIDGPVCPMLVEGLRAVHAWWTRWRRAPAPMPSIEPADRGHGSPQGPRHAVSFLSGGVDGLHTLLRNRRLYRADDPSYIREALVIHGFDIGKRKRMPEDDRFQAARQRLTPLAAEMGVRLVTCRTNLRHMPGAPGFWMELHNGAALAAVAHAATVGPAVAFIATSQDIAAMLPAGTHPCTDGYFSSQRVQVLADSVHLSRLGKLRELSAWPAAVDRLRVCGADLADDQANCGVCEKCLRTRLELLAVGIERSDSLGDSRVPLDRLDRIAKDITPRMLGHYEDLLSAFESRQYDDLSRWIREKVIDAHKAPAPSRTELVGV